MTPQINYKREIIDSIVPYFRSDERYHLLACDMGFGAIDLMRKEFPKRITNCGIMEQGTVGIAAGMSMSGLIPVVYSIMNFLVFRAFEQIRNDVAAQRLNVKFIATGANDYFKSLGISHCCGRNDVTMMELAGIKVYDPYGETRAFRDIVDEWICDKSAGYIRV
ncbi:MAG: transketolase [Candidatus Omnitrophota bacterium]